MNNSRFRRYWLVLVSLGMLTGCGGGSGNSPASGTAARVTATVAAYFEAFRHADPTALRATLAADYNYDGLNAEQASNAFDSLLSLTYRSLDYRVDALTVRENTAIATVLTVFEGNLNLEPIGYGRPSVSGNSRLELELQPRGDAWKLTAVRPFRISYVIPGTNPTRLYDYSVNGQTSLQVPPGASLRLTGKADVSFALFASIGLSPLQSLSLAGKEEEPWELTLSAPATPGRYLARAFSFAGIRDSQTSEVILLHGDQITIPVTVVATP